MIHGSHREKRCEEVDEDEVEILILQCANLLKYCVCANHVSLRQFTKDVQFYAMIERIGSDIPTRAIKKVAHHRIGHSCVGYHTG